MASLPPSVGPIRVPLPPETASAYLETLKSRLPHPVQNFLRDQQDPAFYWHVAAINHDVDDGVLPYKEAIYPVMIPNQWGIELGDGMAWQATGGGVDLMYAASMSVAQACRPVLVVNYPSGVGLIDGCHRVARAIIERRSTHPARLLNYADIIDHRRPECEIDRL